MAWAQCSDAGALGGSLPPHSSSSRLRLRGAALPLADAPAAGAGALQALQLYLSFRWTHRAWPPHPSLHFLRCRPCTHMPAPPHWVQ